MVNNNFRDSNEKLNQQISHLKYLKSIGKGFSYYINSHNQVCVRFNGKGHLYEDLQKRLQVLDYEQT